MKRLAQLIHYTIYLNLITGFLSAIYMVFIVFKPEQSSGPLWQVAKELPMDFFMKRRLYAIEAWIIFGFLALYYAMTTYRKRNQES